LHIELAFQSQPFTSQMVVGVMTELGI